ncbi:hypothetical protein PW5551_00130 [Petrotoga sp. 9PW.55.5.1]|uniref:hypothetical protein n=1 Tax=Petrotoga sp. 9PW.55.5.1 TaxID=1308979 RepID=UPI000DC2A16F|nr:hypothetical protein [Petrotoga sp. 9PW.55.5.1]RAP00072.1 hypothetical protein PW5551_00130 [Petrotoga sp. 9PW.55.5.1]
MQQNEKSLDEIVKACLTNTQFFGIIKDISRMENTKRYELRRKASILLDKENGIDREALRFYYLVTEEGVAEEILRRIKLDERKT